MLSSKEFYLIYKKFTFVGDLTDNQWLSGQIAHTLVFDKVYDYGLLTFFIAKDMKYLNDMLGVLKKYHIYEKDTESSTSMVSS